MKKLMNLKFKKSVQLKLNDWFYDEQYHEYTVGEMIKIALATVALFAFMFLTMIAG